MEDHDAWMSSLKDPVSTDDDTFFTDEEAVATLPDLTQEEESVALDNSVDLDNDTTKEICGTLAEATVTNLAFGVDQAPTVVGDANSVDDLEPVCEAPTAPCLPLLVQNEDYDPEDQDPGAFRQRFEDETPPQVRRVLLDHVDSGHLDPRWPDGYIHNQDSNTVHLAIPCGLEKESAGRGIYGRNSFEAFSTRCGHSVSVGVVTMELPGTSRHCKKCAWFLSPYRD